MVGIIAGHIFRIFLLAIPMQPNFPYPMSHCLMFDRLDLFQVHMIADLVLSFVYMFLQQICLSYFLLDNHSCLYIPWRSS